MAGRHAIPGVLRGRRTPLILAGVTLVTALLIAAAACWLGGGSEPSPIVALNVPTTDPDRAVAAERPSPGRGSAGRSAGGESAQPAQPAQPEQTDPEPEPPPTTDGEVIDTSSCEASYYWEPQPTVSGEVFDPEAMTAANKTWDFDTRVRVTNAATRRRSSSGSTTAARTSTVGAWTCRGERSGRSLRSTRAS